MSNDEWDNGRNMQLASGMETILVIDDERLVISLSHAMLTRYGYTVLTAMSGTEATQLFEKWPTIEVDLLIVDMVMPDMSGTEVVDRIHASRPEISVLYLSPYSAQEELRPSFAPGLRTLLSRSHPYSSSRKFAKCWMRQRQKLRQRIKSQPVVSMV
jgi:CheY-like chemotaxis protein